MYIMYRINIQTTRAVEFEVGKYYVLRANGSGAEYQNVSSVEYHTHCEHPNIGYIDFSF